MLRQDLGFAEASASAFRFLVDQFGFQLKRREPTFVRYESPTAFVNVYHGRSSYELGVEVGPLLHGGGVEEKFMLGDILESAGEPGARAFKVATTATDVAAGLLELSDLTQRFARAAIEGDSSTLSLLRTTQARLAQEFLLEHQIRRARNASEEAFREGNYAEVVRLLRPIRDYLNDSEKERLEYADRHRPSTGD